MKRNQLTSAQIIQALCYMHGYTNCYYDSDQKAWIGISCITHYSGEPYKEVWFEEVPEIISEEEAIEDALSYMAIVNEALTAPVPPEIISDDDYDLPF